MTDTNFHRTALYFAYGSNLHEGQMELRCPNATPVCAWALPNYRLTFSRVADIAVAEGEAVHGVVWEISETDERKLDAYEGYRPNGNGMQGLYRKEFLTHPELGEVMVYIMNRAEVGLPSPSYLRTIAVGYENFNLPAIALKAAIDYVAGIVDARAAREHEAARREAARRVKNRDTGYTTAPVFGGNWAGSFATRGVEHYVPTDDQLDIFEDDGECSDCHTDLLTDEEIADRRCNVCKAAWEALEAGAAVDMA